MEMCPRMPWSATAQLTESLEVVHGQVVSEEVEHGVLKSTSVTIREHESIPVEPARILRVAVEEAGPQQPGDGRHSHWGTWMTAIGLVYHVDCQTSDSVDADLIVVLLFEARHGGGSLVSKPG